MGAKRVTLNIFLIAAFLQSNPANCEDEKRILRMGAFNLGVYGDAKSDKPFAVHVIIDQILKHDIMLLQEIRDKDASSVDELFEKLTDIDDGYKMALSDPLGRTRSKERYAFMYRTERLSLNMSYVIADPDDKFEREPFVVVFDLKEMKNEGVKLQYALLGLHVKATKNMAFAEIQELYTVAENVKKERKIENLVIMGDLNCDCIYISGKELKQLKLLTDKNYKWAIGDSVDTTAKESTNCTYDRIIYTGDVLSQKFLTSRTWNIGKDYNLSGKRTLEVSDHYPVTAEFDL